MSKATNIHGLLLPDQVWERLGEAEEQSLSVSAPCPRAKQLTAAFRMICFEQNTVILENQSWGTPSPLHFPGRAAKGPVRGGSSAPSPPIISLQAAPAPAGFVLHPSGKRSNLGGQIAADVGEFWVIRVRMLSRVPGDTPGMPEVKQSSQKTDPCRQFPTLMSYLGACVPL